MSLSVTTNYVESLRNNFVWGFYDNNVTNTATSPLNVILTSIFGLFINDVVNASIILASFEVLIMVYISIRIFKKLYNMPIFGIVLPLLMVLNPLVISTLGLESILYCTLMIISVYFYLEKNMLLLGIAIGLLSLTRLDGVILYFVIFIFLWNNIDGESVKLKKHFSLKYFNFRKWSSASFKLTIGFISTVLPWILFSWIFLGSFIPETLFIKIRQHWSSGYQFYNGIILYFSKYFVSLFFTILPLMGFIIIAIYKKKQPEPLQKILIIFSIAYFIFYSLLNVPPYHWYYIPIIFSSIFLFSISFTKIIADTSKKWKVLNKTVILIVVILFYSLGIVYYLNQNDFTTLQEAPIHTNWASQQQYKIIAKWLNEHIDNTYIIRSQSEIGTLAYYSKINLINQFNSRLLLTDKIISGFHGKGGIFSILADINFFWYKKNKRKLKFDYLIEEYDYLHKKHKHTNIIKVWKVSSHWVDQGILYLLQNDRYNLSK